MDYRLDLSNLDIREERFGVMLRTCVFTACTRGEFNVSQGNGAGPNGAEAGWAVAPIAGNISFNPFFMTREDQTACTAPIDGVSMRTERPEDQVMHAERAVYVQRVRELQAEIQGRLMRAKQNGSFDTFAETTLTKRLELLVELVANCDECLAAD